MSWSLADSGQITGRQAVWAEIWLNSRGSRGILFSSAIVRTFYNHLISTTVLLFGFIRRCLCVMAFLDNSASFKVIRTKSGVPNVRGGKYSVTQNLTKYIMIQQVDGRAAQ